MTESLHVGDFFNVKNRLQTPQISHQQKMSPTPVSNIDVTHIILKHIGHLTVTFRIALILRSGHLIRIFRHYEETFFL